jgi:hypothetical protein
MDIKAAYGLYAKDRPRIPMRPGLAARLETVDCSNPGTRRLEQWMRISEQRPNLLPTVSMRSKAERQTLWWRGLYTQNIWSE